MIDGWIAVDLDGTLAHYEHWISPEHIGAQIPAMVERVKGWLADGKDVRIFTARVHDGLESTRKVIEDWCQEHIGQVLPITNQKDYGMVELWDDRCVQVVPNRGETLESRLALAEANAQAAAVEMRELSAKAGCILCRNPAAWEPVSADGTHELKYDRTRHEWCSSRSIRAIELPTAALDKVVAERVAEAMKGK